ncbi:hypothetical protein VDP44_10740 [Xanthomonas campestris pv. campestris]|nr:hypothetical protein [Xanthomonas campestris pv. campestris]MEB2056338.1 hypothetical protein [Xanthomonas campestris pv. campestris]
MRPNPFVVRCYAKRTGGQWVAICIDLGLATQSDSFEEARDKLDAQIRDYVHEALTVDRQHAGVLLSRKAPLANQLEYHAIRVIQKLFPQKREKECAFNELVSVPA